jgi:hypothetical protein
MRTIAVHGESCNFSLGVSQKPHRCPSSRRDAGAFFGQAPSACSSGIRRRVLAHSNRWIIAKEGMRHAERAENVGIGECTQRLACSALENETIPTFFLFIYAVNFVRFPARAPVASHAACRRLQAPFCFGKAFLPMNDSHSGKF